MKITALFLVLGLTSIAQAAPKTCTATLGGTLHKNVVMMPDPHVFYPYSSESKPAKWIGNLNTVAFVPPPAVQVECGKPFLYVNFDAPTATGTLPDSIVTLPWEKIGYDGKPKVVDPETLYGIGDSMEYPTPQATFVGTENLIIETLPKEGVSDICKVDKVMLPDSITIKTKIDIDPVASRYFSTSLDGHYEWDSNKAPRGMEVDVELDDPYVNITCDATWDFKMTFEWPFDFEEGDFGTGQVCKGNVQRKMEISGEFTVIEDNKVTGYIEVQEPTVTSSGAVVGSYSDGGFSQAIK